MPRLPFGKLLRNDDATVALVVLFIVVAFAACSIGCIAPISRPEPTWVPDVYVYAVKSDGPAFYNYRGERVTCDDLQIHEFVLIPNDDLVRVAEKFDRCESWR